ncbi:hypothetical protein [Rhizobium hainanense]|nr:hypothetical protein [Rhizobium hainanense]
MPGMDFAETGAIADIEGRFISSLVQKPAARLTPFTAKPYGS